MAEAEVNELRDRLDGAVCAITLNPMVDPVIDPEGNTYGRAAIMRWLSENNASPITRNPLYSDQLVSNRALREVTAVESS